MQLTNAIRDQMLDLAGRFAELDQEQWNSASLCASWRVRDVVAHMTAGAQGAFGVGAVATGLVRHRFDYNRWIAADGQARGQADPAIILQAFRVPHDRQGHALTPGSTPSFTSAHPPAAIGADPAGSTAPGRLEAPH